MSGQLWQNMNRLSIEEKILNTGLILATIGLFSPWLSGRWLADQTRTDTGLSSASYTSFIGYALLALQVAGLVFTVYPLLRQKELLPMAKKHATRLYLAGGSVLLVLAALSVQLKVSFDFPSMEIRFGLYLTLIGSLLSSLYAFLLLKKAEKQVVHDLFYKKSEELVEQHTRQEAAFSEPEREEYVSAGHIPPAPNAESHRRGHY